MDRNMLVENDINAKYTLPGIGSLDTLFYRHSREVALPTFKQKREVERLRLIAAEPYRFHAYHDLFKKFYKETVSMVIEEVRTRDINQIDFGDDYAMADCKNEHNVENNELKRDIRTDHSSSPLKSDAKHENHHHNHHGHKLNSHDSNIPSASSPKSSDQTYFFSPYWKLVGFSRNDPYYDFQLFVPESFGPKPSEVNFAAPNSPSSPKFSRFSLDKTSTVPIVNKYRFDSHDSHVQTVDTTVSRQKTFVVGSIAGTMSSDKQFHGRWKGGVFAMQNLLYYLDKHRDRAIQHIRKRLCFNEIVDDMSSPFVNTSDYRDRFPYVAIAMEITRHIALQFEIIVTSNLVINNPGFVRGGSDGNQVTRYLRPHDEPPTSATMTLNNSPQRSQIPPGNIRSGNTNAFQVRTQLHDIRCESAVIHESTRQSLEQRDTIPCDSKYMYSWRSYWNFILERDAFQRLFVIGMILFDSLFDRVFHDESRDLPTAEIMREALQMTCSYLNDMLNRCESITEMETHMNIVK